MFKPRFEQVNGWSKQIRWTDEETILICLDNCSNLAGLDKNQVERIIKDRTAPPKIFPNRLIRD